MAAVLVWEPTMSGKHEPMYVPADDVDMYGVGEEGWYAVDDDFQVIDGPFNNRQDCLKAIEAAANSKAA